MDGHNIQRYLCASALLLSLIMCMPYLTFDGMSADLGGARAGTIAAGVGTRAYKDPTEVHYAIIAPDAFYSALVPLAEWKTQKGVPTRIYSVENISMQQTGPDLQYKIHKHLEGLEAASPNLTWVLLVGDTQHIPVRYLRANAHPYGFNKDYAGDYYYTGLDSDWDTNGNGVYGEYKSATGYEADLYADAYVGRWPIDNRTQVQWLVDKVLTYEKAPPAGNWVREFEMWGTIMDAPNDDTKYDSFEDNAYKVCQKVYDEVLTRNYDPVTSTNFNITRRYDYARLDGGYYSLANDQLKSSVVIGPMNSGVSVVNFAGQAYYDGTRLAHYSSATGMDDTNYGPAWPGLLSYADDASLTNGYRLPFIFATTCDAANFTKTNDEGHEQLFMNPGGGAIGFLSNTGTSYRGEDGDGSSHGNWWLDFEFWNAFKFDLNTQPAKCWFDTVQAYRQDVLFHEPVKEPILANMYGYLYMGDPEVDIWTDSPAPIVLQSPQLYTGGRNYTFKVMCDGKPLPYARICMRSADLYETFQANISGVATHFLSFPSTGSVDLTITGHNGLYNSTTLDVLVAPPDLFIDPASLTLSNTSALKAGDEVNISVTVRNIGGLVAPSAQVRFYDGVPGADPNATQINAAFPLGDLAAGDSKQAWVKWTAEAGNYTLFVSSTSGAADLDPSNNNASIDVTVLFPDLEINGADLVFTPGGIVIAGTLLNISFVVKNNGTCDAALVKVAVYDGQMAAGVLIGETLLDNIPFGQQRTGHILWTVTPGDHAIYAYADPDQDIFEYDRADNVASGTLEVDSPPAFQNMSDITISEDAPAQITSRLFDLSAHVTDQDDPISNLTFSASAAAPNAVKVTGTFLNLSLAQDWSGKIAIAITASDPYVSAGSTLNVTVVPVNDPPMLNISKRTFQIYEHTTFTLKISAYDIENDSLTFADDTALFDIDPMTGIINYTPKPEDLDKTFDVNITVTDQSGASDIEALVLEVIGVNDRPEIDPIADRTIWVGSSLSLTVTASDPDGDTLTFSDNTPMFDINASTGIIQYIPAKEHAGNRNVTITVSDGELSDSYTFMITIKYNDTGQPDDDVADDDNDTFVGSALFYGLIIAAVIVLVAIVVIALLLMRKKKDEHARPAPAEEPDTDEDLEEPYDRQSYESPAPPAPVAGRQKGKGKRHKDAAAPAEEGLGPIGPGTDDTVADDMASSPAEASPEEMGPEDGTYAEKGEMDFDDESFEEAFGEEPNSENEFKEPDEMGEALAEDIEENPSKRVEKRSKEGGGGRRPMDEGRPKRKKG